MKTDDLINAIVADQATQRPDIRRTLLIALTIGLLAASVLFVLLIGMRQNAWYSLLHSPAFGLKFVVTLSVAIPAFFIVRQLVRPDGQVSYAWLWLLVPVAVLAMRSAYEMMVVPSEYWHSHAFAPNWWACVHLIPFLSLAPLAGVLYALRDGAPSNPALAGAFGGLLSGALGATLYASHCSEDSAMFVGLWHPVGIAMVTALGALLASRIARW